MIHPTAVIDPTAQIGANVSIGPYSVIGANVTIGDECEIGPHVVIKGPTTLGKRNKIVQFASIGEDPQDKKYAGEPTELIIGDDNLFREYVTINRGTVQDGGKTVIGNNNWIMAYCHIAHDCHLGNGLIFSNGATLAGHVHVGDHVLMSANAMVHQFCRLGTRSFVSFGTGVTQDVPPYVLVSGPTAKPFGINSEGLRRAGVESDTIMALKRAYKAIYRSGLKLDEALVKLEEMATETPEVQPMVDFIRGSTRSIAR